MNVKELASYFDASLVKNNNTIAQIEEAVVKGKKFGVASVITLPCYSAFLVEQLKGSDIIVGGVLGFPWGGEVTEVKVAEAKGNLADGVQELDMVMNLGLLFSEKYDAVVEDIARVKEAVGETVLKVIIESPQLSRAQLKKAAELVIESGADYVKTATGFNGVASLDEVKSLKDIVGDRIKVKAAGGIRSAEDAEKFIAAGADRLGIGFANAYQILETGFVTDQHAADY